MIEQTDIVIQPDDKIVVSSTGLNVGGDHDFAVLRYEANGVLDTNFTENFGASGIR
ncbi:MAG: delta-60 repeat domain-containing protein [Chloracidobacterium sp.]|nr:delta-60 repeat domain-containing protein [Chloracidobacterium sp.]